VRQLAPLLQIIFAVRADAQPVPAKRIVRDLEFQSDSAQPRSISEQLLDPQQVDLAIATGSADRAPRPVPIIVRQIGFTSCHCSSPTADLPELHKVALPPLGFSDYDFGSIAVAIALCAGSILVIVRLSARR
jgi:hypothetical protein